MFGMQPRFLDCCVALCIARAPPQVQRGARIVLTAIAFSPSRMLTASESRAQGRCAGDFCLRGVREIFVSLHIHDCNRPARQR